MTDKGGKKGEKGKIIERSNSKDRVEAVAR